MPRDAAALAWMANLGCLELHPHPVRAEDLDHPDELRIDLDPVPGVEWTQIVAAARVVREAFADYALVGWPKTSGSRGIHVNVRLHRRWTFPQAVNYFMEAGGLDKEAADGEAAGAATSPTQKISYITGKWQIMQLLGKYRDAKGASFRLGQFHDDLISYGSLPVSIVQWLLLDDPSEVEKATGMKVQ